MTYTCPKCGHVTESESVLSEREAEVLALRHNGLKNKEIAVRLQITYGTVKNHMHNIKQKLQTANVGKVTL